MIIVGVTGSIGMGKTTICNMLKKLGCAIHNSDRAVALALSSKGDAFEEVAVTFPECWDKKNRVIKKDVLADIIFNDDDKKRELEAILHPIVWRDQQEFTRKSARMGYKIAVLDIPLLFETGAQIRCDYTICVSAPYSIQRRRVLARPGMSEEKFEKILMSQIPDVEKRKLADFVVETGLGMAFSFRQLKSIVRKIL
ncbi:MAG: dephospho-CoA kinase [Pseudomonadota bacterium]